MTLAPKIPATIVTGFLGAGKTTLLRRLVRGGDGRRLAFVINEFGELGIDRELIRGCAGARCNDEDIVELANGCICCTVADDFLPTIEALLDRDQPPEHIVIETSGLALPKPLIKAFAWPEVSTRASVDGVIAVVDGPAVAAGRFPADARRRPDAAPDHDDDRTRPSREVFADQVMAADLVVLHKADLMDETALAEARRALDAVRRLETKVVVATEGEVDPRVLLGLGADADDLLRRPSHHDDGEHEHDDFTSFTVALDAVGDPAALEARLKSTVTRHPILRVKGFLDLPAKPMRHVVQGVGTRFQRYFDRPWGPLEARRSELVVIGLKGLDRAAIAAELRGRS